MLTPRELEVLDVVGEVMQERLTELRTAQEREIGALAAKVAALEARDMESHDHLIDALDTAAAEIYRRVEPLEKDLEDRPTSEEVLKLAQGALTATRASLQEQLQIVVVDLFKALPIPEKGDKGEPGRDGASVTIEDFRALFEASYAKFELETERRLLDMVQRTLDRIPLPKDGKDGVDGFGFDDFTPTFDGERTLTLRFAKGDRVEEFPLVFPHPIDQGVWKPESQYVRGDGVSWNGSWWIAQRDAPGKPNEPDSGWRLAVKKARDGKDGTPGLKGDPGPAGRNGRDLTGRLLGSSGP